MGLSFVNFFRKMSTFVHNATSKHTATVCVPYFDKSCISFNLEFKLIAILYF